MRENDKRGSVPAFPTKLILLWRGWWGEEPPYHAPVFVLTNHERAPLAMQGGTTLTFVTDGIRSALSQVKAAAGGGSADIYGGANVVRQYLQAGPIDELGRHIAPVVLGTGERLLNGLVDLRLEPLATRHSPLVTHLRYRGVK